VGAQGIQLFGSRMFATAVVRGWRIDPRIRAGFAL